jgi:NAD(P)-dependent dehydrogenase (short-subunit alcohol dehydrogenase family)
MHTSVVLITGASGNLGLACARRFLTLGWRLVLVDRAPERLRAALPESDHPDHLVLAADLADFAATAQTVAGAVARTNRIDALVNTVGGYSGGQPFDATPAADFERMFAINVLPVLNTCRAAIPFMVANRSGRIINVASRHAAHAPAGHAAYAAAKAAVLRLTESIAADYRSQGVTANCVLPGTLDTPANRAALPNANHADWLSPDSLAGVIAFLASPQAIDLIGVALPVGV